MKAITTYTPLVEVTSADLNEIQARAVGSVAANANNELAAMTKGIDCIVWQSNASIADAAIYNIDTNDWHDRIVWGFIFEHSTTAERVGGSTDYNFDALAATASTYFQFAGYLGKGAYSNTAGAGVAVSNGFPPTRGTSGVTSWFVNLTGTAVPSGGGIALYTDPVNGKLYLYNANGAAIRPTIVLFFTGATGKRP